MTISRANLFIVGPSKTGTTSLYRWLQQHPDIQTPTKRNTYFFYKTDRRLNKGFVYIPHTVEEYNERYFPEVTKKIVLESCDYLYSYRFYCALREGVLGRPKIIVIDRNPFDRLRSNYEYYKYGQGLVEEDIETYIKDHAYEYVDFDAYVESLRSGADVKVIPFEKLLKNPERLMKELFKWLEIPPVEISYDIHNKTRGMKYPRLHDFFYEVKNFLSIKRPMPKWMTSIYLKLVSTKKTLTKYEKRVLERLETDQEYRHSLGFDID